MKTIKSGIFQTSFKMFTIGDPVRPGGPPNDPERNDPFKKEERDNDPTRIRPGINEPEKNDPTRIDTPGKEKEREVPRKEPDKPPVIPTPAPTKP